jgi:hypothetical protein
MIQLSEQEFVELIMRAAYRVMQDVYHEHQREVDDLLEHIDVLRSQNDELNAQICTQNANDTDDRWPYGHNVTTCEQVKAQRHKAVTDENSEGEL